MLEARAPLSSRVEGWLENLVGAGLAALLSLLVACSLEEPRRFLPWPDQAEGAFVLWAGVHPEILLAGESRAPVLLDGLSQEAPLELWRYDDDLAKLSLDLGTLQVGAACRACDLLEPARAFRIELPFDWHPAEGDERMRQALVADREQRCDQYCPPWELERVDLSQGQSTALVYLASDRALVVASSGAVWRIGANGPAELFCRSDLTEPGTAAFRPPDQLWVQAQDGLHALEIRESGGSCPRVASISGPASFRWLAVSAPPAELELVGVGHDRTIHHYFGGQWSQLATLDPPDPTAAGGGGAIWLGGRSFAAAHAAPVLVRIEAGVAIQEPIHVFTFDGSPTSVAGMAAHPSLGLVLAIHKVGLITKAVSDEVLLVPSRIELGALAAYSGGLMYLDQAGTLATFHLASEVSCRPQLGIGVAPRWLVRLADGTSIVADPRFADTDGSAWVHRYYLPGSCARRPALQ